MRVVIMEDARMERDDIGTMRTNLSRFLRRFQSCAQDKSTRNYFRLYTSGLMSELPRKNCEAIALQAGVPVRSMQWFLAGQVWDHERMRNKIQKIVAKEHRGKHQIGVIDETSFVKTRRQNAGCSAPVLRHGRQTGKLHRHGTLDIRSR